MYCMEFSVRLEAASVWTAVRRTGGRGIDKTGLRLPASFPGSMPMSRAVDHPSRRFPGRRAFITGAAGGLGLEFARRFAAAGWSLGLLDLEPARLAQARQSLNTADS